MENIINTLILVKSLYCPKFSKMSVEINKNHLTEQIKWSLRSESELREDGIIFRVTAGSHSRWRKNKARTKNDRTSKWLWWQTQVPYYFDWLFLKKWLCMNVRRYHDWNPIIHTLFLRSFFNHHLLQSKNWIQHTGISEKFWRELRWLSMTNKILN